MTPNSEIVAWLREQADHHANQDAQADAMGYSEAAAYHDQQNKLFTAAANALEERAGLAGQVVLLKEALDLTEQALEAETADWKYSLQFQQVSKVKALPLEQAAAQVAEWRRDAERYRHLKRYSSIEVYGNGLPEFGTLSANADKVIDEALKAAKGAEYGK
jgi:hypothetical protein